MNYEERYEVLMATGDVTEAEAEAEPCFTAYSLTPGGVEPIETYHTLAGAVEDCLQMWPEDNFDMVIEDAEGVRVASLEHGRTDPARCHVFDARGRALESYRCVYTTTPDGRVATIITGL